MKILIGTVLSCTLALSCIGVEKKPKESRLSLKVEELNVEVYRRKKILPILPVLMRWAVRDFKAYPFLWEPVDKNQLIGVSDTIFVNDKNAFVLLAKEEEEVVGLLTAIPFDSQYLDAYFGHSFFEEAEDLGYDASKILYVGYFLTAPKRRNDPAVVSVLYDKLTHLAVRMGRTQLCYFEDMSRFDVTTPVAEIEPWGYVIKGAQKMGLSSEISWTTRGADGSLREIPHYIEFSLKEI